MPRDARRFRSPPRALRAEDGGVSVEWVVLAAAVTGVFVAALDAEKSALGAFWGRINGDAAEAPPPGGGPVAERFDFDGADAAGWNGATVADIPGFGRALGPITGSGGLESVSRDFAVPAGAARVTLTFDLYALDSLDRGEAGVLYVNGREVGRVEAWSGGTRTVDGGAAGIAVSARALAGGADLGGYFAPGYAWSNDSITEITITIDDPGDLVSFGFGSTADGTAEDESFAIDSFRFEATGGPQGGAATAT